MPEINLTTSDGLIESNIKPRKETYYLVTEEHLKNINGKNILTDLFSFIASILWGAYFSVTIVLKASDNLKPETKNAILTYQDVFIYSAVAFSILAIVFLYLTYTSIAKIKKSSLTENAK